MVTPYNAPRTSSSDRQAAAHVLTAKISNCLLWVAIGAAIAATIWFGLIAGLAAGAIALTAARAARSPMPDDIRRRY